MNSYYNEDVAAGYVKFTDNEIVKTETISKNIYVDLDINGKPVGVEIMGMKNKVGHPIMDRQREDRISGLESDRFQKICH